MTATKQLSDFPSTAAVQASDLIYSQNVTSGLEQKTTVQQLQANLKASLAAERQSIPVTSIGQAHYVTAGYSPGLVNMFIAGLRISPSSYQALDGTNITITNAALLATLTPGMTVDIDGLGTIDSSNAGTDALSAATSAIAAAESASEAAASAASLASAVSTAQGAATAAGQSATTAGQHETAASGFASAASGSATTATQEAQAALNSANAAAASATVAQEGVASSTIPLNFSLPATAGASATATAALGTVLGTLVLQVQAKNNIASPTQNYQIQMFDGSAAGTLIYTASGITDQTFTDNSCFFIPPLTSGNLFVVVTNIDADAMTLAMTIKTLGIQ